MGEVRGVPDLLDGYTADTVPTLSPVRDALERYRAAVSAFNAAEPNDLGTTLSDLSGEIEHTVDQLDVLDRIPAAFAAALRQLDASYNPFSPIEGATLRAEDGHSLNNLILAYLIQPGATDAEADQIAEALRRYNGSLDSLEESLPEGLAGDAYAVVQTLNRYEGWSGALGKFGRVGGNAALAAYESTRLTDLRARYPASSRVVVQASRSADAADAVLQTNRPFLPSLGVHAPAGVATAARVGTRAVGVAGMGLNVVDAVYDAQNEDWRGVASNAVAFTGSWVLMASIGGPVTMTVAAVAVVGSLIYEANREEIHRMADAAADSLGDAAEAVGDFFGF
jgi:hypothetical protein